MRRWRGWPASTCLCPMPPTSRGSPCRIPSRSLRPRGKSATAARRTGDLLMTTNILMPALSPTMTEGRLAKWMKKEGDEVKAGDVIAEIETDKATMEVEAVDEGRLQKILVQAGTDGVPVNAPIAVLLGEGEDPSAPPPPAPKPAAPAKPPTPAAAPMPPAPAPAASGKPAQAAAVTA